MRQQGRESKRLAQGLFFLAIANFLFFLAISIYLGGDAFNGKVEKGHYYLLSHGRLTEVSPRVWKYSWWHEVSVFITHPLGIAAITFHYLLGAGRNREHNF